MQQSLKKQNLYGSHSNTQRDIVGTMAIEKNDGLIGYYEKYEKIWVV